MYPSTLSKADAKVLAYVFDPESAPTKAEVIINPDLPADPRIHDAELLQKLKSREKEAITMIERYESAGQGSSTSKESVYRSAMAILNELIDAYPDYASAWNNRAQLRRWRFGDRNTICQPASRFNQNLSAAGEAAVRDLERARDLASPVRSQDAVSPSQGRLLAQIYTQLGALYFGASKDLDSSCVMRIESVQFSNWSRERFEEEASRLFYLGGLYGNEVAQALAVHTNPHAKLCGSIVKEAMRKELAGVEC